MREGYEREKARRLETMNNELDLLNFQLAEIEARKKLLVEDIDALEMETYEDALSAHAFDEAEERAGWDANGSPIHD